MGFRQSLALAELAFPVGFIIQLRRSADRSPMEVAKEMLIASRRSPLVSEDVAAVCTQLLCIKILEILDFASKLEICAGCISFHFIDPSLCVYPPVPRRPPFFSVLLTISFSTLFHFVNRPNKRQKKMA